FTVEGLATIGRADDCQIRITERDVSRRHATVELTPEGVRLTDLGSTGGTWGRGEEVTATVLAPGASFRVGGRVTFEGAPAAAAAATPPEPEEAEDDSTRFIDPAAVAAATGVAKPEGGATSADRAPEAAK